MLFIFFVLFISQSCSPFFSLHHFIYFISIFKYFQAFPLLHGPIKFSTFLLIFLLTRLSIHSFIHPHQIFMYVCLIRFCRELFVFIYFIPFYSWFYCSPFPIFSFCCCCCYHLSKFHIFLSLGPFYPLSWSMQLASWLTHWLWLAFFLLLLLLF